MNIMQSYFAPQIPKRPKKHVTTHRMDGPIEREYTTTPDNRPRNPFSNMARRAEQIKRVTDALTSGCDTVNSVCNASKMTETLTRQILEALVIDGIAQKETRERGRHFFFLIGSV